jgi:hypothetical protein
MINNLFSKFVTNELFFCFIIFLSTYLKIFRVIYYLRIILEYLPLYNGYKWPISLIYLLTSPVTRFYEICLPSFYILPIDPTFYITIDILNNLIGFIDDIKDACAENLFS